MVDSENSTSLPSVSRRDLLGGVATIPAICAASLPRGLIEPPDPILPLWKEWQQLHARATGLCQRWQEIETRLMRAVGYPQVFIPAADGARAICAQSHWDIDQAVATGNCSQDSGTTLHAELAARQTRWDIEAKALGFNEANRQELEAWRNEEAAVRAVFRTKAATLAGVEVKLALMIQLCLSFSSDPDFPLPQLRSTIADVKRLRGALDTLRF